MRRVVSLCLPRFPTDRLRRAATGQSGGAPPPDRPLVTALSLGQKRLVAAVDARAQETGLRPGMTVAHAQALVPDLLVADADPDGDAEALERLASWALRYSPLVATDPPDGLLLDIAGAAHLFGGEPGVLAYLLGRIGRNGLFARAAIAGTAAAAAALARHGLPSSIVPDGEEAAALDNVSVAGLRLPEEVVAGLRRLGVERIGQLQKMPRGPLARRFGRIVGERLDAALGDRSEPIEPLLPAKALRQKLVFAEPLGTAEALAGVIGRLAQKLCGDLEAAGLGARRVDFLCRRVDGVTAAIRVGTARATRDPAHLSKLLAARLETIDPGFGIDEAMLVAVRAERLAPRQIFGIAGETEAPDLAPLIDRLAARLGPGRLYRAAPVESDFPERSSRKVSPLAAEVSGWPDLPRPVRLIEPPEPVETIAGLPDHPPALFVWRRIRHRVRRADGPERVFGEWWRSDAETGLVRDYYRIEDEAGARFWLFRDGRDNGGGRWFLHGLFG
jgi:protein ImuB